MPQRANREEFKLPVPGTILPRRTSLSERAKTPSRSNTSTEKLSDFL